MSAPTPEGPGPDLVELNRWHAALVNAECHWDLRQMPEVERRTAIADVLERISERLEFDRIWK